MLAQFAPSILAQMALAVDENEAEEWNTDDADERGFSQMKK